MMLEDDKNARLVESLTNTITKLVGVIKEYQELLGSQSKRAVSEIDHDLHSNEKCALATKLLKVQLEDARSRVYDLTAELGDLRREAAKREDESEAAQAPPPAPAQDEDIQIGGRGLSVKEIAERYPSAMAAAQAAVAASKAEIEKLTRARDAALWLLRKAAPGMTDEALLAFAGDHEPTEEEPDVDEAVRLLNERVGPVVQGRLDALSKLAEVERERDEVINERNAARRERDEFRAKYTNSENERVVALEKLAEGLGWFETLADRERELAAAQAELARLRAPPADETVETLHGVEIKPINDIRTLRKDAFVVALRDMDPEGAKVKRHHIGFVLAPAHDLPAREDEPVLGPLVCWIHGGVTNVYDGDVAQLVTA